MANPVSQVVDDRVSTVSHQWAARKGKGTGTQPRKGRQPHKLQMQTDAEAILEPVTECSLHFCPLRRGRIQEDVRKKFLVGVEEDRALEQETGL